MRKFGHVWRILFVVVLVGAVTMGTVALAGKGGGKKSPKCPYWDLMCPDVWDPVVCDDGVVYSNDCYARRACATGCQPTGGGGPVL